MVEEKNNKNLKIKAWFDPLKLEKKKKFNSIFFFYDYQLVMNFQ